MRTLLSRLLLALTAAVILLSGAAPAQPLTENFNSVAALGAAGWVMTNNSGPAGPTSWFQGNTAVFSSQSGAADSYVAANFNGTTFGGNVSNWLITPVLSSLSDGTVLTFYARTEITAPAADRLEVRLSTNGPSTNVGATDVSVGDFSALLLTSNPVPATWTQFTVTLSGIGAGPVTGRIAFRHVVTNSSASGDFLGIDTVSVGGGCPPPPPLVMTAPAEVGEGSPNRVASVAQIAGATYAWTISNGTITSGQGTNQITFTAGVAGTLLTLNVAATVGLCPSGGGFANVTVLPPGSAIQFYPLTPCRLLDTRNAAGPLGGPALLPAPAPDRPFAIAGVCGVPADARAVSLNVTVTNVQMFGALLLYRGDGAPFLATSINFRPGITRANNSATRLSLDGFGAFKVQNLSAGTLDFIVDVNGYFR